MMLDDVRGSNRRLANTIGSFVTSMIGWLHDIVLSFHSREVNGAPPWSQSSTLAICPVNKISTTRLLKVVSKSI